MGESIQALMSLISAIPLIDITQGQHESRFNHNPVHVETNHAIITKHPYKTEGDLIWRNYIRNSI